MCLTKSVAKKNDNPGKDDIGDNGTIVVYFSATGNTEKVAEMIAEIVEGKVRVRVTNTGEPIPEESLSKVWEKFYKVDKARTREYGGSGIGLSIVKAIMEAHGQAFGVVNTKDGVCFWFELDRA